MSTPNPSAPLAALAAAELALTQQALAVATRLDAVGVGALPQALERVQDAAQSAVCRIASAARFLSDMASAVLGEVQALALGLAQALTPPAPAAPATRRLGKLTRIDLGGDPPAGPRAGDPEDPSAPPPALTLPQLAGIDDDSSHAEDVVVTRAAACPPAEPAPQAPLGPAKDYDPEVRGELQKLGLDDVQGARLAARDEALGKAAEQVEERAGAGETVDLTDPAGEHAQAVKLGGEVAEEERAGAGPPLGPAEAARRAEVKARVSAALAEDVSRAEAAALNTRRRKQRKGK